MASSPIPKIDNNNEVVGETTIAEARQNGWPRRVTRIMIVNEKDQFLLQKRSAETVMHPNVWDCSGGHVDIGETYMQAGIREVAEELGVTVELKEVSLPVLFEGTFYQVCTAKLLSEVALTLKIDEVAEVKWISTNELSQMITLHPSSFTPWIVDLWINLKDELV